MALTDEEIEKRLKCQDELYYANLGGMQAIVDMMQWAYDRACDDMVEAGPVFPGFIIPESEEFKQIKEAWAYRAKALKHDR